MKKLLVVVFSLFAFATTNAQSKAYLGAGVQLVNNKLGEAVEIGAQSDNNRFAVVGEHFSLKGKDFYQTGVKYTRLIPSKVVDLLVQGAVKANVSNGGKNALSFEPGLGAEFKVGPVSLQTSLATSMKANTDLFRPTALKAGMGLIFKL